MPIIRYEQNDIGSLAERECACGWKFRHLIGLQGRKNDSFTLPGGRTLSSGFLLDATYEVLLTYREEVRDFASSSNPPTPCSSRSSPAAAGANPSPPPFADAFRNCSEAKSPWKCVRSRSARKRNPANGIRSSPSSAARLPPRPRKKAALTRRSPAAAGGHRAGPATGYSGA